MVTFGVVLSMITWMPCCNGPHSLPWYRYNYSLTVLPQYLELVILNLPGVLWRLSFGPSHPRSEAARSPA